MNWQDGDSAAIEPRQRESARAGLTWFMAIVLLPAGLLAAAIGASQYSLASRIVGGLEPAMAVNQASGHDLEQLAMARIYLQASYGMILLLPLCILGALLILRFGPRETDTERLKKRFGEALTLLIRIGEAKLFLLGVALIGAFCMGVNAGLAHRLDLSPAAIGQAQARADHALAYTQAQISREQVESDLNQIERFWARTRALEQLATEIKSERFLQAPDGIRDSMSARIRTVLRQTTFEGADRTAAEKLLATLDPQPQPPPITAPAPQAPPAIAAAPTVHHREVAAPAMLHRDPAAIARFHAAIRSSNVKVIAAMLAGGWDPRLVDPGHDTALYEAVAGSNIALVRLMLDHGADPDVRSPYSGQFPINVAARCSASVLNLLLQRGATVDVCDAKGWTPLHHAADIWNAPAVQTLLRHRAPVNVVDQQNRTPLDCARNNARSAAPERQWVIDLLTSYGGKTAAQLNANTAAIDPAR